jgi:hypothetical protein
MSSTNVKQQLCSNVMLLLGHGKKRKNLKNQIYIFFDARNLNHKKPNFTFLAFVFVRSVAELTMRKRMRTLNRAQAQKSSSKVDT